MTCDWNEQNLKPFTSTCLEEGSAGRALSIALPNPRRGGAETQERSACAPAGLRASGVRNIELCIYMICVV